MPGCLSERDDQINNFEAHQEMASRWWRWMTLNIHTKTYSNPEYWICGFCRSYVKQSKVPIMRLEQELNLSTIEMKTVRKVGPVLCQHCYRVRLDYSRFQLGGPFLTWCGA
eukprot:464485_1